MDLKLRLHFDPTTGYIRFWERTNAPVEHVGLDYIDVDPVLHCTKETHKVDLIYRIPVELADDEKVAANAPEMHEVNFAIMQELAWSDKTQLVDYPLSTDERKKWAEYRHSLRRLSDLKDPSAMVRAWPPRPDGSSVGFLRGRT
jgi:hypothetical protein